MNSMNSTDAFIVQSCRAGLAAFGDKKPVTTSHAGHTVRFGFSSRAKAKALVMTVLFRGATLYEASIGVGSGPGRLARASTTLSMGKQPTWIEKIVKCLEKGMSGGPKAFGGAVPAVSAARPQRTATTAAGPFPRAAHVSSLRDAFARLQKNWEAQEASRVGRLRRGRPS